MDGPRALTVQLDPLPDRILTAYHEAGHAVVGLFLGRVLEHVDIEQTDERGGQTKFEDLPADAWEPCTEFDETRSVIEVEMVIDWAGSLSQAKVAGLFHDDPAVLTGFGVPRRGGQIDRGSDIDHVYQLAEMVGMAVGEIEPHVELMRQRAIALVDRPDIWADVATVADALLEHDRLSGDEVLELLDTDEAKARRLEAVKGPRRLI